MKSASEQIHSSARWADGYEFRLDLIRNASIRLLRRATRLPTIATLRPKWEGGQFSGSEEERIAILIQAAKAGVEFIDIEAACGVSQTRRLKDSIGTVRLIVSHHSNERPISSARAYGQLAKHDAEVLKWVFPAEDLSDIVHVREFLEKANRNRKNAIAIASGGNGELSRILYRKFGGWGTFASAEKGPAAADGQLPASVLKDIYRSDRLTKRARVFGVLGFPLRHSKGIYVHNALFATAKADAVYVRFPTENLASFFRDVLPCVSGCSVTIPYKVDVMRYCDALDRMSQSIGAVNTIHRRGGKLLGRNTDARAALDAIETKIRVKGRTILVLGAGGAARAIVYESMRRGAKVLVAGRSLNRAAALAQEFGATAVSFDLLDQVKYAVVANATPVGMFPDTEATPFPARLIRRGSVVFDAVYNPPRTRLIREAERAGANVVPGTDMYLRQAAAQQRFFLRRDPDPKLMKRVLDARVQ